jgi:hypothetical protein
MNWYKQLFCNHDYVWVHPINAKNRGYWRCVECWKAKRA